MNKYKTYKNFDLWFSDQSSKHKKTIDLLRKIVKESKSGFEETSKWGNGCWTKGDLPVAYIHTEPSSLQFGFFAGSLLQDPEKILKGKGKYVRFIEIEKVDDINKKALLSLINEASTINYRS